MWSSIQRSKQFNDKVVKNTLRALKSKFQDVGTGSLQRKPSPHHQHQHRRDQVKRQFRTRKWGINYFFLHKGNIYIRSNIMTLSKYGNRLNRLDRQKEKKKVELYTYTYNTSIIIDIITFYFLTIQQPSGHSDYKANVYCSPSNEHCEEGAHS